MSFTDDIKGQNTQLYPVVVIDGVYYSTNNVSIDGNYCKPILMNIPSVKESIDIESRNFKISNVSLDFNNFFFEGKRFSDQLSELSLINKEAIIYYKSPSTNTVNEMYELFRGIIRRISHDDEKVHVELEDLTEKEAHKELPLESFSGDEFTLDKYKNKPIPMVYGHVNASPLLLTNTVKPEDYISPDDSSTIERYVDLICDYKSIYKFITIDPKYQHNQETGSLYVYENSANKYLNVCLESKTNSQPETTQYTEDPENMKISLYLKADGGEPENFPAQGMLECEDIKTPISIEGNWARGVGAFYHKTIDGSNALINDSSFSQWLDNPEDANDDTPRLHFKQAFHSAGTSVIWNPIKFGNLSEYGRKLFILIRATFKNSSATTIQQDYPSISYTGIHSNANIRIGTKEKVLTRGFDDAGLPTTIESGGDSRLIYTMIPGETFDIDTLNETLYTNGLNYEGNIGELGIAWQISGVIGSNYGFIESKIEYLNAIERFVLKGLSGFDFYANINGRINTFNDHPFLTDGDSSDAELYDEFVRSSFIENPIDIIYDILRSELGLSAEQINKDDYEEARTEHSGWKFAFTLNKKMNSKKLIEDIAKSTKCFPKFRNDGTFGFNTIKDSYSTSDYDDAHPIKQSDVISYSFKKTKPEQIYRQVDVQYNMDYAQDSLPGRTTIKDNGASDFYGIESPDDAYLEFESPYIRTEETAENLRDFLAAHYKNDHLIFNLKLPLQYIDLKIGELVKFEELFQGLKAYGIDYRVLTELENDDGEIDYFFPLFMITSITRNLDSISIECMQLHYLGGIINLQDWDSIRPIDADPLTITPFIPESGVLGENLWTNPDFTDSSLSAIQIDVVGDEIVIDGGSFNLYGSEILSADDSNNILEEGKVYRYEFEITESTTTASFFGIKVLPEQIGSPYVNEVGVYSFDLEKQTYGAQNLNVLRLFFYGFRGKIKNNISVREVIQEATPFDGGFSPNIDSENWTTQTQWTISNNIATYDATVNSKNMSATLLNGHTVNVGEIYEITFTISNVQSGKKAVIAFWNEQTANPYTVGATAYDNGTHTVTGQVRTATSVNQSNKITLVGYTSLNGGSFSISNLSYKKIEASATTFKFRFSDVLQQQEFYKIDNKLNLKDLKDME